MLLAIDPGLEGAMAFMCNEGKITIVDMPTILIKTEAKKTRKTLDEASILAEIAGFRAKGCKAVILEQVTGLPGQSASAAFNFGVGYGLLKMAIRVHGMALHQVPAIVWKRAMRAPSDKNAAILRASELLPSDSKYWDNTAKGSVSQKSGRAEAALMLLYTKGRIEV